MSAAQFFQHWTAWLASAWGAYGLLILWPGLRILTPLKRGTLPYQILPPKRTVTLDRGELENSAWTLLVILVVCGAIAFFSVPGSPLPWIEFQPLRADSVWTYLNFVAVVLAHDAYFFWTHWAMHRIPALNRYHVTHHRSYEPTPLSAFSFHPVEAVIHFVFFIGYPLLIPSSPFHLLFGYAFMLAANFAGHLNHEYYPKNIYLYPIVRTFNAPTHHILHHRNSQCNFGIYYMWWDRWMKTLHPRYHEHFAQAKNRANPAVDTIVQPLTTDDNRHEQARVHSSLV